MSKKLRATVHTAANGEAHWRLIAPGNNKKIAVGGETFTRGLKGAADAFETMAGHLRKLTDEEYAELLATMRAKITK